MSLLDVVRSAVKIADTVTKSLQATVRYERATGKNEYGVITYASAAEVRALVEFRAGKVYQEGILVATRATVTLLDMAEVVAVTGGAGVSLHDRFTLPDGSTGPTMAVDGLIDAGTGKPIPVTAHVG